MTDTAATSEITVVPANEASWEDIQAVLGTRGGAAICQCQRFKLQPKESFGSTPVDERAFRLREQTSCGDPDADTTSANVVTNRSRSPSQIEMPASPSRVIDPKAMASRTISRITAINWIR